MEPLKPQPATPAPPVPPSARPLPRVQDAGQTASQPPGVAGDCQDLSGLAAGVPGAAEVASLLARVEVLAPDEIEAGLADLGVEMYQPVQPAPLGEGSDLETDKELARAMATGVITERQFTAWWDVHRSPLLDKADADTCRRWLAWSREEGGAVTFATAAGREMLSIAAEKLRDGQLTAESLKELVDGFWHANGQR